MLGVVGIVGDPVEVSASAASEPGRIIHHDRLAVGAGRRLVVVHAVRVRLWGRIGGTFTPRFECDRRGVRADGAGTGGINYGLIRPEKVPCAGCAGNGRESGYLMQKFCH